MAGPKIRCAWCGVDPLYIAYHDEEWGVPVHDDRTLFEMITLEGAQAGLSWITVLRKRDAYRRHFANFDPAKVAALTPEQQAVILQDPGIVRNRLKVASTVSNARAFLAVQAEFGSFDAYLWTFTPPRPGPLAEALSKDLKRRGFRFVGGTIMYAFLQAVGVVNDHAPDCWRR